MGVGGAAAKLLGHNVGGDMLMYAGGSGGSSDLSENQSANAVSGNNYNSGSISPLDNAVQTNEEGEILPGVIFRERSWFKRAWRSVKNFFSSFEVEANVVYSLGIQAGVGIQTPIGGLGIEANAISVDLASGREIINGKNDANVDYIGKDYWMTLRQGAGIDYIVGGNSIEREMRSPTGGGAFFDKKVTEESKIFGYYDKKEYYQDGFQTQNYPKTPTYSNGLKFGFNFQFLFGAKIDFEIRRRK